MAIETKYKKIVTSGKRKTSVARAMIIEGSGKVTINKKDYQGLQMFDRLKIEEPLRIAEAVLGKKNFDVVIKVRGGGEKSQIEASRLALARAIVKFSASNAKAKDFEKSKSKELEEAYVKYDRNLLVADVRRKEAYKPGDSKARSMRQSSKR